MNPDSLDVASIARFVVTSSYRAGEPVTNLQLQKILFAMNAMHILKAGGAPLFSNPFDQTPHGPAYPVVFEEFDRWGGAGIEAVYDDLPPIDADLEQFVVDSAKLLRSKTPHELMEIYVALKDRF